MLSTCFYLLNLITTESEMETDSNCIHSPPDSIAIFFSLALKSKIQKFVYRIQFYFFIFLFVSFLTHLCVGIRVCLFFFWGATSRHSNSRASEGKSFGLPIVKIIFHVFGPKTLARFPFACSVCCCSFVPGAYFGRVKMAET